MRAEAPQLPLDETHARFHSFNLLTLSINGIARMEHWRRRPYETPVHLIDLKERIAERTAKQKHWSQQRQTIEFLTFYATHEPEIYQESLLEAQRAYHLERSENYKEHASALWEKDSRLSRFRAGIAERRQISHRAKAMKAAAGLLSLS